ncbi:hypothetical protein BTN50_0295 [Candidatus Enterovibrio altilux]|uniref:Mobile element protein n=1 Tax=Candidatus Enterovibrio altilux TaxID=1927128 RepID=A0A291B754_9GAMM|nr:hypothetical protein BTN50_0295 [Candidatus Enterovibrio luxaltus]
MAVDINTHEIIIAELSASNMTGGEVLSNLRKQICKKLMKHQRWCLRHQTILLNCSY